MIGKDKTVAIRKAREAKEWRNYYFGVYLPKEEFKINLLESRPERGLIFRN